MIARDHIPEETPPKPVRSGLDEAIERFDALRKKLKAERREKRLPKRFYWQDKD
jgi:hypothetical protein